MVHDHSRRRFIGASLLAGLAGCAGLTHRDPPLGEAEAGTQFRPSIHGWPFKNFKAKYTAGHFTVCGGMCWTALDRFMRGERIDRKVRVPEETDPLYEQIKNAQLTSLKGGVWETIVDWTFRPELDWWWQAPSQGFMTQHEEWPNIRSSIATGKPVIVCVVRADQWENPAQNHQVIVYGYRHSDDHVVLSVYDPNYPSDDSMTIGFDVGRLQHRLSAYQASGRKVIKEKVRGLLVIPFPKDATPTT